jgi:uncharacterized protein YgiB involved in biofilm formation
MKSNVLKSLVLSVSIIALTAGCGKPKEEAVKSYKTVEECRADIAADATSEERSRVEGDCQKGFDQSAVEHERTVTRYVVMDSCTALYERCVPARDGNGFVPFMTGFMLGYVSGAPIYHPYYYDRYHVVYSGTANLGYYRSGYIMTTPGSAWTRGYASVSVNKGTPPPPVSSTRGVFGGTASAFVSRGGMAPSLSKAANASPSGRAPTAAITSTTSARGVFGGTASASASSSSG